MTLLDGVPRHAHSQLEGMGEVQLLRATVCSVSNPVVGSKGRPHIVSESKIMVWDLQPNSSLSRAKLPLEASEKVFTCLVPEKG